MHYTWEMTRQPPRTNCKRSKRQQGTANTYQQDYKQSGNTFEHTKRTCNIKQNKNEGRCVDSEHVPLHLVAEFPEPVVAAAHCISSMNGMGYTKSQWKELKNQSKVNKAFLKKRKKEISMNQKNLSSN